MIEAVEGRTIPFDSAGVARAHARTFLRRHFRHAFDGCHRHAEQLLVRVSVDGGDIAILAAEYQIVTRTGDPVEHRWRDHVEVHPVLRRTLVPPLESARARIQHHDRIREQVRAGAVGLIDVRPGIAYRYEQLTA